MPSAEPCVPCVSKYLSISTIAAQRFSHHKGASSVGRLALAEIRWNTTSSGVWRIISPAVTTYSSSAMPLQATCSPAFGHNTAFNNMQRMQLQAIHAGFNHFFQRVHALLLTFTGQTDNQMAANL
ncbi:Uncharacterised protein [Cedecea neteri]|uniref:Uncharacterized protein n=1 Tax=Cedecea neteri TaxID=158822 RepID=A0A2X2TAZ6_9ENTR|nr:Uncharacterised protein [Cedecea neteri]